MKQKHYPITVCGHKAVYTVELTSWNTAKITFKFNHRRGQTVKITHLEDPELVDIKDSLDFTVIQFWVNTANFKDKDDAVYFCKTLIDTVNYAVNLEAKEELVTKELFLILG